MQRRVGAIVSVLLLGLCPGFAQGAVPVMPSQIAYVVARDLGWNLQDSSVPTTIRVLAPDLRLPPDAQVHVAAVFPSRTNGTWLLRMECSRRVECLPFGVALQGLGQMSPPVRAASEHFSAAADKGLLPLVVRAGQRVNLAEEISGMRLSVPAICLQAGRAGQRIRVRNLSSRRVVLARVRAAGEVAAED